MVNFKIKNLIKDIIRPIYIYFSKQNEREFSKLLGEWGGYERYKMQKNVKFLDFVFDVPDLPSFIGQFKEIFVENSYKFISKSEFPVIIDCGANIGTSCIYFKTLYPQSKIIAFEADTQLAKILDSNLKKNNINDVRVIAKAVWIDNNGITFSSEGADGGSIQGSGEKEKVDSIKFKDFLEKAGNVDLLKIDIEGAEYDVIKDCQDSLTNVDNIFIEYHSWNNIDQKLSEILEILVNNQYRYYINTICERAEPFVDVGADLDMDLQLNIYGVRR
jgi:FkbM family methyltransferase